MEKQEWESTYYDSNTRANEESPEDISEEENFEVTPEYHKGNYKYFKDRRQKNLLAELKSSDDGDDHIDLEINLKKKKKNVTFNKTILKKKKDTPKTAKLKKLQSVIGEQKAILQQNLEESKKHIREIQTIKKNKNKELIKYKKDIKLFFINRKRENCKYDK